MHLLKCDIFKTHRKDADILPPPSSSIYNDMSVLYIHLFSVDVCTVRIFFLCNGGQPSSFAGVLHVNCMYINDFLI